MAKDRRDEQKLWLILFQIKGLRSRLNFLAFQHWLFSTLAILIGGAALVFGAAFIVGPLKFLVIAAVIVGLGLYGLMRAVRWAVGSRVSAARAAAIADERASLKGRLLTVLAASESQHRSPLWPYLVEDTYGRRESFEPARIEPRWFSPSIFGLLAAVGLAMLLAPFALSRRAGLANGYAIGGGRGEITADIGNLDIRPADPALQPNAQIFADENTLRKLRQKLANEEGKDASRGSLSRWMDKARDLAGNLQSDLTGHASEHRPPMRLRLTDRDPSHRDSASAGKSGPTANGDDHRPGSSPSQSANANASAPGSQASQPSMSLPQNEADRLARNETNMPGQPGPDSNGDDQNGARSAFNGSAGDGGGSSHGAGSDPEHLFGPPSAEPLGSNSFKITIDAQPSDESSTPGAPAYVPPKIRVPLNSTQYPDEPLARASVPAADQLTIKRVFER
ncbi:MAG TPA: hypothetical protein VJ718_06615 [Candidatus Binataceae bacterium]|nr:hypothetical protein [Candidatus Binataceae bacterium]